MKILITGANGYLGQGITQKCIEAGLEVVAADASGEHIPQGASVMTCDLFAVEDPYTYFGKPDILLHLAWRDGFSHYSDAHMDDLPKHYRFLRKMAESGIRRLAVMGTVHEVGFFEGAVKESTPCNPTTPYGISKNALRQLTFALADKHGIPCQWLRGYYIVGNSAFGSSVFSKITAAEKAGKADFPFTMGQTQFDFLDYDDFCLQTAAVVCQDDVNGIINICSGYPQKLAERVERFIADNHYAIRLNYGAFPDRPYDSKAVWGSNEKITRIMANRDSRKD